MHNLTHLLLAFYKGLGKWKWRGACSPNIHAGEGRLFLRIQHFLVRLQGRPGALYLHNYSFHADLQAEVTQVEYSDWPCPGRPLCGNN